MSRYIGMKLTRHIDTMQVLTKHLYATTVGRLWVDEAGGFDGIINQGFNPWRFGPYSWVWGL